MVRPSRNQCSSGRGPKLRKLDESDARACSRAGSCRKRPDVQRSSGQSPQAQTKIARGDTYINDLGPVSHSPRTTGYVEGAARWTTG